MMWARRAWGARRALCCGVRSRALATSSAPDVVEKIAHALARERTELMEQMQGGHVDAAASSTRIKDLEAVHRAFATWREHMDAVDATRSMSETESDADMRELARQELEELQHGAVLAKQSLRQQILSSTQRIKSKGAILELRQGVGGQESCLFLYEMLRMYTRYCERKAQEAAESGDPDAVGAGWRVELLSSTPVDVSATSGSGEALREAIVQVHGDSAYDALRFEAGVHRVQRIPATQNLGKLQTSTMAIIVLPMQGGESSQADDIVDPKDVKMEVMRARGAGGQHVNRTESAVRLTHEPTGITVSMQDSRSQHQNRAKAWEVLRARLLDRHLQKEAAENKAIRRAQVASADRSERVRTYNFPQDRVTDHRVGISLSNIQRFMDGDDDGGAGLTYLVEELRAREDKARLEGLLASLEDP